MKSFRERGIRAVKMDDIAHNLGISKRTLYELYSNKEDLLVEVIKLQFKLRQERMEELKKNCNNVMDILTGVLGMQIEYASQTNSSFYKDLVRYSRAEKLLESYYDNESSEAHEFFAEGVKEGFFIDKVNFDIFKKIMANNIKQIRTSEEFSDLAYQDLFLNYLYVAVRGICTKKGIEQIDAFINSVKLS